MIKPTWALIFSGIVAWAASQPVVAESKARPSNAKTYRNPLLDGQMMADPDILEIDGKFYLYGTTHGRGYDVYVSTNLIDWRKKGLVFADPRGGAWAPDLYRAADGRIYLYYTDNVAGIRGRNRVKQIGVAVADNPLGPFEDRGPLAAESIDAHLFCDDDGKLYLYYVSIADGFKILVRRMTDPLTPAGDPELLMQPTEPWERVSGPVTEGPFVLKRGDTYYLMYSGTSADSPEYAIGYAVAKSPMGPFTKHPGNPIVRGDDRIFGPGHHCVVEGPDGRLWMAYHQKHDNDRSYDRFLALDRIWFNERGEIEGRVTRDADQPAPAP